LYHCEAGLGLLCIVAGFFGNGYDRVIPRECLGRDVYLATEGAIGLHFYALCKDIIRVYLVPVDSDFPPRAKGIAFDHRFRSRKSGIRMGLYGGICHNEDSLNSLNEANGCDRVWPWARVSRDGYIGLEIACYVGGTDCEDLTCCFPDDGDRGARHKATASDRHHRSGGATIGIEFYLGLRVGLGQEMAQV